MLLDIHEKPIMTGLSEEFDWDACEAFEDYVYCIADSVSDARFASLIRDVRSCYDDYYSCYEG